MLSRTLGDFVVGEKLGQGGFGAVYLASQPVLDRQAVIKVLRPKHRATDEATRRFLREARLASQLDHPYAAHIYAFGAEDDGLLWIAMERVRGTTLGELLAARGRIELSRFVPLLGRICEVVHTAHQQGIVHRDLKPENVMVLSRAGRLLPKLLDFGIARAADAYHAPADDDSTAELSRLGLAEPEAGPKAEPEAGSRDMRLADTVHRITSRGAMVGSPPFMAPEQWVDASQADGRADQYALAAMTFEALTGTQAFPGESLWEIAAAHARKPPPPLGDEFPAELNTVLARAMAKSPDERFDDVLEFARAFRVASGLAVEEAQIPGLDDATRTAALANAPQPIADAVARFEAARNPHQARDALWSIADVVARYIGLVALACRSHTGPGSGRDPAAAIELMRALRREVLGAPAWMRLARELCASFRDKRDAYPIPELVSLFYQPGGALCDHSWLAALFDSASDPTRWRTGDPEQASRQLKEWLPAITELLAATSFLARYSLVVPAAGHGEKWMGVGRRQRPVVAIPGRGLDDHRPALLDADSVPVVSLWPVMQVARPSPESDPELFLLAGAGRHGARLIAAPRNFERCDESLWSWFADTLLVVDLDDAGSPVMARTPYRGLAAFTLEDADGFVGRERETEQMLNRLREKALCAVVGPSGAGKSSFVQAGVLPALAPDWHGIIVRPGPEPIAALAARLERHESPGDGDLGDGETLERTLERDPGALGARLRASAQRRGASLVLVVDQLEELFTLGASASEARLYARALTAAARSSDDAIRVIVTLRDDFLGRAAELPGFRSRLLPGAQLLTTPSAEDLRRILVVPAQRLGYAFEDDELPDEMVAEVAEHPSALALLSFAAARLWDLRDRSFKQLSRASYRAMGGVTGALAQHAETTIGVLRPDQRPAVRQLFRRLITADGTRARLLRSEAVQILHDERAGEVIETLLASRILTTSEAEDRTDYIEVVHEALLSAWPRLVAWRREDAEGARMRDRLRQAAGQWHDSERARGLLWRGDILAEYRLWRSRYPGALTAGEQRFVAASLADESSRRRTWQGAIAAGFLVLFVGVFLLYRANQRAEQLIVEQYEERGRQALLGGDPADGLRYLHEAFRRGADSPALRFMLARAADSFEPMRRTLRGHTDQLWTVAFSPDSAQLITGSADGTARIWDVASGALRHQLSGHQGWVWDARFSPDQRHVATASFDGSAILWSARDGALRHRLAGHEPGTRLESAAFSRDSRHLLTTGIDGSAHVWDTESGALTLSLAHDAPLAYGEFNSRGDRIATASYDHKVRLWHAQTGELIHELDGHSSYVLFARFGPDDRQVLTVSYDETARLWDADTGALRWTLVGHQGAVTDGAFSADGSRVVTVSRDGTAMVWDCLTGRATATLRGHSGYVNRAAFIAGDRRIVTVSQDGTARIWNAQSGSLLATLAGHGSFVFQQAVSPRGRYLATASWDGTARLWDLQSTRFPIVSERSGSGREWSLWLPRGPRTRSGQSGAPVGPRLLTGGPDRPTVLEDPHSDPPARALPRLLDDATAAAASPSTSFIAAARSGATIAVWDRDTPAIHRRLGGHEDGARWLGFPSDSTLLTLDGAGSLRAWDLATGEVSAARVLERGDDVSAALSRDRAVLATYRLGQKTIQSWTASSLEPGRSLANPGDDPLRKVVLSSDGRRVASLSTRDMARVWDRDSGELLLERAHPTGAATAAFGPGGHLLAVGTRDGTISVWQVETGELMGRLEGHFGHITCLDLGGDGRLMLSGSGDETAKLWDLQKLRLLASLDVPSSQVTRCRIHEGGDYAVIESDDEAIVWGTHQEQRTPEELDRFVRCQLGRELAGNRSRRADSLAEQCP